MKPLRSWYPNCKKSLLWTAWAFCRFICFLLGVRRENFENFPKNGPVLVIAPHVTYLDWLLLYGTLPRPPHFMADSFFVYQSFFSAWFTWIGGVIPINRKSADPYCLRQYLRLLSKGEICAFFPEGGRSMDGRIMPLMTQAVKLTAKANVPVAVIAFKGLYDIWPRWDKLRMRRGRIKVQFIGLYKKSEAAQTYFWKGIYDFKKKINLNEEHDKLREALNVAASGEPRALELNLGDRIRFIPYMLCFCPICCKPNSIKSTNGDLRCADCQTTFQPSGNQLAAIGKVSAQKTPADWYQEMIDKLKAQPELPPLAEKIQLRVDENGMEGTMEPASLRIDKSGLGVRSDSYGMIQVPLDKAARGSAKGMEVLEIPYKGKTLVLSTPGGNAMPWIMLSRKLAGWKDLFSEA